MKKQPTMEWWDRIERELHAVAEARGGVCEHMSRSAGGTEYYEIFVPSGTDDPDGDVTLRVRVADHPTAHCSEDISLVFGGGGPDDHGDDTPAVALLLDRLIAETQH